MERKGAIKWNAFLCSEYSGRQMAIPFAMLDTSSLPLPNLDALAMMSQGQVIDIMTYNSYSFTVIEKEK